MADFYNRMQQTATRLLTKFNQGVIQFIRDGEPEEPANPWEPPVGGEPIVVTLQATAKGVGQEYLSEGFITQSDIHVTAADFGYVPTTTDRVSIDGVERQILMVQQIPAAGVPVSWVLIVKG